MRKITDNERMYSVWYNMKRRCCEPANTHYKYYGGRGIKVCDRWLNSFKNFCEDMGLRPNGHQIDRINNDGNYEPSNCRWATIEQQVANRRYPKRTHCHKGHQYTESNTRIAKDGSKICRECKAEWSRKKFGHNKRELLTHCKRGHPYDETNTRITPERGRICRACRALWEREKRAVVKKK